MKVHDIASAVITIGRDRMGPQEPLYIKVMKSRTPAPMRMVVWFR